VDSEIPSPVEGVLSEILFKVDDVVPVGTVIAILETEDAESTTSAPAAAPPAAAPVTQAAPPAPATSALPSPTPTPAPVVATPMPVTSTMATASAISSTEGRFYSPLVKSIAKKEQIGQVELDSIPGSGAKGRVTKKDILSYLASRSVHTNGQNGH